MGTYKITGTKSETARIMVFDESDWNIDSNTVVSGSGTYEATASDASDKTVLSRTNDGEVISLSLIHI